MNELEPRPERRATGDDELGLAELLKGAGARAELPAEDLEEIAAATRAAWRFQVHRRRRRRVIVVASSLAALLALAVAIVLSTGSPETPAPVGEIAAINGRLLLLPSGGSPSDAIVGGPVLARTTLETGASGGRAALALGTSAISVRLDEGTRVRLLSTREIELLRGAVYVDTGETPGAAESALRVRTPFGTAHDLGTQFSVRLLAIGTEGLEVRVRTGSVAIERRAGEVRAAALEEVVVRADGSMARRPFAADDPDWTWAIAAAPPYQVEGRTLAEVLRWSCRESGWSLRFAEPALARAAEEIRVRGGIGSLPASQAPFAVLPGAGLDGELVDGVLKVSRAR